MKETKKRWLFIPLQCGPDLQCFLKAQDYLARKNTHLYLRPSIQNMAQFYGFEIMTIDSRWEKMGHILPIVWYKQDDNNLATLSDNAAKNTGRFDFSVYLSHIQDNVKEQDT